MLEDKIKTLLNKKYRISTSKTDIIIIELIDIIKKSAGKNISVTQNILDVLSSNSQTKIFKKKSFYLEREEKKHCYEVLSQNNVLLLTGLPFCGKTLLAMELA